MRTQVEAATSDLLARLSTVTDKQDDLLEKQHEMDGQIRDVGGRVEAVQGGVAMLHEQVGPAGAVLPGRAGMICW